MDIFKHNQDYCCCVVVFLYGESIISDRIKRILADCHSHILGAFGKFDV